MAPNPYWFPALENGQGLGVDGAPSGFLQESSPRSLGTFHLTHHQLGYHGTGAKIHLSVIVGLKPPPGRVSTESVSFPDCESGGWQPPKAQG